MAKSTLDQFYSEDYRELYTGSKNAQFDFFDNQYKHGKEIITYIKKHTNTPSFLGLNVMEIGCGAGGILLAFKEEGADIFGIDLGNDYLEYGIKKHGLNLHNGRINNFYSIEKKPDILIYSHVLEHVYLPDELFNIIKICHENTLLYIEVPGVLSIQKNYIDFMLYLQNAHLYSFSLGTLNALLSKYNFSLIHGNEDIKSVFCLKKQGIKEQINYYNKIINYLIATEKRRKWNIFKRNIRNLFVVFLCKIHLLRIAKKIRNIL